MVSRPPSRFFSRPFRPIYYRRLPIRQLCLGAQPRREQGNSVPIGKGNKPYLQMGKQCLVSSYLPIDRDEAQRRVHTHRPGYHEGSQGVLTSDKCAPGRAKLRKNCTSMPIGGVSAAMPVVHLQMSNRSICRLVHHCNAVVVG